MIWIAGVVIHLHTVTIAGGEDVAIALEVDTKSGSRSVVLLVRQSPVDTDYYYLGALTDLEPEMCASRFDLRPQSHFPKNFSRIAFAQMFYFR